MPESLHVPFHKSVLSWLGMPSSFGGSFGKNAERLDFPPILSLLGIPWVLTPYSLL